MGKHFEKRNFHTIYIRENLKPVWAKFIKLIVTDIEIMKDRYKSEAGLISVAIMRLINQYVVENESRLK